MKDSGKRESFEGGMVRDTTEGKTDYSLVLDGPMFKRWAIHLTKGAIKYAKRNWMKASGQEELDRFRESALRHFIAWFEGERDEDHAAAVIFNINGAEYVQDKLSASAEADPAEIDFHPGNSGVRTVAEWAKSILPIIVDPGVDCPCARCS